MTITTTRTTKAPHVHLQPYYDVFVAMDMAREVSATRGVRAWVRTIHAKPPLYEVIRPALPTDPGPDVCRHQEA